MDPVALARHSLFRPVASHLPRRLTSPRLSPPFSPPLPASPPASLLASLPASRPTYRPSSPRSVLPLPPHLSHRLSAHGLTWEPRLRSPRRQACGRHELLGAAADAAGLPACEHMMRRSSLSPPPPSHPHTPSPHADPPTRPPPPPPARQHLRAASPDAAASASPGSHHAQEAGHDRPVSHHRQAVTAQAAHCGAAARLERHVAA